MANSLFYKTVTPLLLSVLKNLMAAKEFDELRLIGGTGLSLYRAESKEAPLATLNGKALHKCKAFFV